VKIGGDFMAGRFLSVPYFYAVILLAQIPFRAGTWAILGVIWLGVGLQAPLPTLRYNENYNGLIAGQKPPRPRHEAVTDHRGIADERGHYYPYAGLLPVLTRQSAHPPYGWALVGQEARRKKVDLVLFGTPGFYSYLRRAGRTYHRLLRSW
jgi:arabinofuranosyltransferase